MHRLARRRRLGRHLDGHPAVVDVAVHEQHVRRRLGERDELREAPRDGGLADATLGAEERDDGHPPPAVGDSHIERHIQTPLSADQRGFPVRMTNPRVKTSRVSPR